MMRQGCPATLDISLGFEKLVSVFAFLVAGYTLALCLGVSERGKEKNHF